MRKSGGWGEPKKVLRKKKSKSWGIKRFNRFGKLVSKPKKVSRKICQSFQSYKGARPL